MISRRSFITGILASAIIAPNLAHARRGRGGGARGGYGTFGSGSLGPVGKVFGVLIAATGPLLALFFYLGGSRIKPDSAAKKPETEMTTRVQGEPEGH